MAEAIWELMAKQYESYDGSNIGAYSGDNMGAQMSCFDAANKLPCCSHMSSYVAPK